MALRYPVVKAAECPSVAPAPTRPDSRTICSSRCHRMARALCLRLRMRRLRRRMHHLRRRTHRPFWSVPWRPRHRLRVPPPPPPDAPPPPPDAPPVLVGAVAPAPPPPPAPDLPPPADPGI